MIHDSERRAYQRGAEAMRKLCVGHFNAQATQLREQQRTQHKEDWTIARDLRLSAEIADQERAAHLLSQMPLPEFMELPAIGAVLE